MLLGKKSFVRRISMVLIMCMVLTVPGGIVGLPGYSDVHDAYGASVFVAPAPIPVEVVNKMNSVRSKFLTEDVPVILAAQLKMKDLSDVNVVLTNVWPPIAAKIAASPNPSDYDLLTPLSILKLMRAAALMTYADPSGIEDLRVSPEHRPVMEQLQKLGSLNPSAPIDLVPNDFVDFFYAVEKKVINDAMANLNVEGMKTLIKGKVKEVLDDNSYKLSQIFNNIGITFTQLESMKDRIHDAVDPNWEAYKGVSFAYARDGLDLTKTYEGVTRFFNPTFKIYDFTLPSGLSSLAWKKESGDEGVTVSETGTVTIPLSATPDSKHTAVISLTVNYTDKSGVRSKQLFSEEMTFTYKGADLEAPTAPTNLTSSDIGKTSVKLDWTASTDNAAVFSYKIYVDGVHSKESLTNSFTLTGLTAGTTYKIKVSAVDAADNESTFSNEIEITTLSDLPKTAPTDLKATNITATTVDIDAKPSIDASKVKEYVIYRDGVEVARTATLPFTVTGLSPNNVYSFTIKSVDIFDVLSDESLSVSVNTDLTPPTAPTNLNATAVTETGFTLNATPGSDTGVIKEYEIYQDGVKIATVPSLPYVVTGLTANTSYKFTIKTVDSNNNVSPESETLTVITDITSPTAPTNLTATNVTETGFTLNATPGTDNDLVKEYEIYRDGVKIATVSSLPYEVSGLEANKTYQFTIKTVDRSGNISPESATLTVNTDKTPPTPPTNLTATNVTETGLRLNATAGTDNSGIIKGYEIYRDGIKIATVTSLPYNVTGLNPSTIYNFTIRTIDSNDNVSAPSETLEVMTTPDTVQELDKPRIDTALAKAISEIKDLKQKLAVETNKDLQDELKDKILKVFNDAVKTVGTVSVQPKQTGSVLTIYTKRLLFDIKNSVAAIEQMKNEIKPTFTDAELKSVITANVTGTYNVTSTPLQMKFDKQLFDGLVAAKVQGFDFSVNNTAVSLPTAGVTNGATLFISKQDKSAYRSSLPTNKLKTDFDKYKDRVKSDVFNYKVVSSLPNTFKIPVTVSIPLPKGANADFMTLTELPYTGSVLPATIKANNVSYTVEIAANQTDSFAIIDNQPAFTDIKTVPWANKAINFVASRGIISGKDEDTFDPRSFITRAELTKLMVLTLNVYDKNAKVSYTDVNSPNRWFYSYVASAAKLGIVTGYPDGSFQPNRTVTREEMAAIIARALKAVNKRDFVTNPDAVLAAFSDRNRIAGYAKEPIASLVNLGILRGSNGRFLPKNNLTRAEAAVATFNLFNFLNK